MTPTIDTVNLAAQIAQAALGAAGIAPPPPEVDTPDTPPVPPAEQVPEPQPAPDEAKPKGKKGKAKESETKPALLLAPHHNITAFSSTDDSRYVIQSVYFDADKKRLVATDGRLMMIVPCAIDESGEFPPVSTAQAEPPGSVILPAELVNEAFAKLKKRAGKKCKLPILNHLRVDATKNGTAGRNLTLTCTDLDTTDYVCGKEIEGTFPNYEQVWPTAPAMRNVIRDVHVIIDAQAQGEEDRSAVFPSISALREAKLDILKEQKELSETDAYNIGLCPGSEENAKLLDEAWEKLEEKGRFTAETHSIAFEVECGATISLGAYRLKKFCDYAIQNPPGMGTPCLHITIRDELEPAEIKIPNVGGSGLDALAILFPDEVPAGAVKKPKAKGLLMPMRMS